MIRTIVTAAAVLAIVAGVTTPASAATDALTADQLTVLACTELPDLPTTGLLNPPDCSPATVDPARARILALTAGLEEVQAMCVHHKGHTAAYRAGFCTAVVKRTTIRGEIYASVGVDDRVFLADA